MFQRTGLTVDTSLASTLARSTSHLSAHSEPSMSSTSPTAPSSASVVTPVSLGLASPTGHQSSSSLDTSPAVSVPNSASAHSAAQYESAPSAPHPRSSLVSAVVENNSALHPSHHLVPMYANTPNSLFGASNSAPSTLVMTPPSPYSEMSSSMLGSESSSLMQHASPWYHTTMRTQHHSYPDMIGSDWSSQVNSGFTSSANSPLSACAYPMSLPGAYSNPITSVYHPHPHGCNRPGQEHATAFYENPRFNASYHPHSYYPNAFFSSSSPTGHNQHSFAPLSVGTEMNQMTFAPSTLLNSSPDSGLTVSSEGNESPSLANHSADSGAMLSVPTSLTSGSLSRAHGADLDEDIKPNIGQQQEATSTTSNSSHGASNGSSHLGMYTWMKKSTNSNSSQSSTGKTRTKDKYRVVYTETQRVELEKEFHFSRYITIKRKSELACQLLLSERQVKIWFQNRRAKDRKQQRKRDEMLKKEKKDNSATAVSTHPGALLSSTPGVLVVPNSVAGLGQGHPGNLLMTSASGSTIHHHTQARHSVAVVAPSHHFSTQAGPHSLQPSSIIQNGYRDMMTTISQMTTTTPTVVSEIAH